MIHNATLNVPSAPNAGWPELEGIARGYRVLCAHRQLELAQRRRAGWRQTDRLEALLVRRVLDLMTARESEVNA